MTFAPLGDQAILAQAANEGAAVRFAAAVRAASPAWLEDVVPAYASVGIYFDPDAITLAAATDWLKTVRLGNSKATTKQKAHTIPVCYEMAPDMPRVAQVTRLKPETIIARHLATTYTVYAIGFAPGFPYLGYLPRELSVVPRLDSPRLRVEPGSVGLAGRQTGIYPLPRPGGWNLIGRTPLTIVDLADNFFPLAVGDSVSFTRIDEAEYARLDGERLACDSP